MKVENLIEELKKYNPQAIVMVDGPVDGDNERVVRLYESTIPVSTVVSEEYEGAVGPPKLDTNSGLHYREMDVIYLRCQLLFPDEDEELPADI